MWLASLRFCLLLRHSREKPLLLYRNKARNESRDFFRTTVKRKISNKKNKQRRKGFELDA